MNLLKLASVDKRRLSACYVKGSCVYTTTLQQIHRGVLIFIRSAKRSGELLWRYTKPLSHSVNAIVLNVVIFNGMLTVAS